MATNNIDADTAKSMMNLAAGILAFSTAIIAIVNNRLQKARSMEHKQRIIGRTVDLLCTLFALAAFIFLLGFSALKVAAWLWAFSMLCVILSFLLKKGPVSRIEVLAAACYSASVAVTISIFVSSHWLEKILKHPIEPAVKSGLTNSTLSPTQK